MYKKGVPLMKTTYKRVPVYTKATVPVTSATSAVSSVNWKAIASIAFKSLAVLCVVSAAALKLIAILLGVVFKIQGGYTKKLMRGHRLTSSW